MNKMKMQIEQNQINFFSRLKKKLKANALMAEEVAQALQISRSEAYNKISGKSLITLTQLEILCSRYNINFEINSTSNLNCCNVKFTSFHTGTADIGKYLESLLHTMFILSENAIKKLSCATDDIPFYHLFKYAELAAFKLHFWNNRIIKNRQNLASQAFNINAVDKKNISIAYNLYELYQTIPCVEIWTKSHLLITIDQVRYAAETQVLRDKALGRMICEQLKATLSDIESYAIRRSKTEDADTLYDWYFCDVVGSVTYLAEVADKRFCFLRFNTFNHFQSEDDGLCNEVDMWLKSLLTDATGFSGHASKHRNEYLQNAFKACDELANMF